MSISLYFLVLVFCADKTNAIDKCNVIIRPITERKAKETWLWRSASHAGTESRATMHTYPARPIKLLISFTSPFVVSVAVSVPH